MYTLAHHAWSSKESSVEMSTVRQNALAKAGGRACQEVLLSYVSPSIVASPKAGTRRASPQAGSIRNPNLSGVQSFLRGKSSSSEILFATLCDQKYSSSASGQALEGTVLRSLYQRVHSAKGFGWPLLLLGLQKPRHGRKSRSPFSRGETYNQPRLCQCASTRSSRRAGQRRLCQRTSVDDGTTPWALSDFRRNSPPHQWNQERQSFGESSIAVGKAWKGSGLSMQRLRLPKCGGGRAVLASLVDKSAGR